MSQYEYDLCVIGGGSGGVRAARLAAEARQRVALIEEYRLGGTCVIRGCIPKKLFVYASAYPEIFADAAGFGWRVPKGQFSWDGLRQAKDKEIARLSKLYERNLRRAGVRILRGQARLLGPHEVQYGQTRLRAKTILLAVGARPFVPSIPGHELAITSNEAFDLPRLPRSVVIVGGGYIGVEFAGILHGFGVATTLIYRGPEILRGFDDEVRTHIRMAMERKGIKVLLGCDIVSLQKQGRAIKVRLDSGRSLTTGQVFYATGRKPYIDGLGLQAAAVRQTRAGAIGVNRFSQTSVPSIFAIGDVTDRLALTPVAIQEAVAFVATRYGRGKQAADHQLVPSAVFSQPQLGTIGLTEAQARARYKAIRVYVSQFRPLKHTLSGRAEMMLMKLITAGREERIVGLHIVGDSGAEMIQAFAVAIKMGARKRDFDATMAVHPTAAEELVTLGAPTRC